MLAATELLARMAWDETDLVMNPVLWGFRDHPTLLWMYRPSEDITCDSCPPMRTNALGLRGPDVTAAPAPDTFRVISLGESTTFGAFVREEATYTARLEHLLDQHLQSSQTDAFASAEAINAGVEAWSVWQSRVWLEEQGLALKPDAVLVYHQLNDTLPVGVRDQANYLYQVRDTDRVQLARRQRWGPIFGVLLRSRAYLALRRSLLRLPSDLPTPQEGTLEQIGERVPSSDRRQALEEMLALTEEAGVQLIIIRPHYAAAQKLLRATVLTDFAEAHDLPLVDLPTYLRLNRPRGVPLYLDGVHPSPAGHDLYARAIAEVIFERGLLEAR